MKNEMCAAIWLFIERAFECFMYVVRQNNISDLDGPSHDEASINVSNGGLLL